ncbi:AraC family transcriptional regulator [Echinicola vietnamensis]|uniref:DNA-binding domain-containing protein, AraC-type n=1 Tax=Echinicola vietnamensis (strain DSM 17526 / LMG 23754 / KMM 6221) TaxID=926556 RepID=L0G5X3_ECHVK|nr:AraC family transcriptional regulator [Echinicola vietnamensis]AGA80698.1 DNA-binding domain-containing protein, AraC-type [Echinicola vietnamensis DSM 17526]
MKPYFHKVPITNSGSFSIRHDIKANFGTLWHYHPELELHYIVKGEGIQYIGDNISSFSSGDMIFLGQNLPHTWRCHEDYFVSGSGKNIEAYILQFQPNCFGKDFFQLPETYAIPKLYEKAKHGLNIKGETKRKLERYMQLAVRADNLDRLIHLLQIIKTLCETNEYETIAPGYAYSHLSNLSEMARLEKIYTYVMAHYKEEITLDQIASIAYLSKTSFCRYFKTMTNKTFYDFLIEIRISNACKLLIDDRFPIEIICYECGFNNVSNFYRHFKKVTKLTPNQYRNNYLPTK